MISNEGIAKMTDFQLSTKFTEAIKKHKTQLIGTPHWMAPEVITGSQYTFFSDIWSIGITAIELATGQPPFFNLPPMKVIFKMVQS
jgi:serine/threonine-protein kinase 24/25/MST4